jgi:hypothetical protein
MFSMHRPRPLSARNRANIRLLEREALAGLLVFSLWDCTLSGDIADGRAGFENDYESRYFSHQATLAEFSLEGELEFAGNADFQLAVVDQLRYTVGQLNGDRSASHLDGISAQVLQTETLPDGAKRIAYRATFPVAWGKGTLPATYSLVVPRRVDRPGLEAFTKRYGDVDAANRCLDGSAHDVSVSSFWYYYRPRACTLDSQDVVRMTASVRRSENNTQGKYPEYQRIWQDGSAKILAVFSAYDPADTSGSDVGERAFRTYERDVDANLNTLGEVEKSKENDGRVIQWKLRTSSGDHVEVRAYFVSTVMDPGFLGEYRRESENADVVIYSGHAGLGGNIDTLAYEAKVRPGHYHLFVFNGCDTFAYFDDTLPRKKRDANADDSSGFKYLDLVINAMPTYFEDMAEQAVAWTSSIADREELSSYADLLRSAATVQVAGVAGEENNTFTPDGRNDFDVGGRLAWREESKVESWLLPAGTHRIYVRHAGPYPVGDVDLYLKVGSMPSPNDYACTSRGNNSEEACEIWLEKPSVIHAMLLGFGTDPGPYVLSSEGVQERGEN